MSYELNKKIMDKAVEVAAIGLDRDAKKGSTQINNLLNMIQSDKTPAGLDKLMLYIARQSGKDRKVIYLKAAKRMVEDLQYIGKQDIENPADLAVDYLTYLKWGHEALVGKSRNIRSNVSNLKDLLKTVGD